MSAVHLDIRGPIAEIRLANPEKLNALTSGMLDTLEQHAAAVEAEKSVRVVLLTAEGDRAFCAGADIRDWSGLTPRDFARDWVRRGHRVFDRLARLPAPLIGVLGGHAFGGGLELAATCDIRVAAPKATFALPETGVGIVPGWSGTQRLAGQIPPALLKEMALTGARISAERAYQVGFVNGVSETPEIKAKEMADSILSNGPQATETAKWMIAAALGEDAAAGIEALAGAAMAPTDEKAEGVVAFFAKRKPEFEG
ncbi:MAG: enoyl-CoA hydratase/isomerase family protein [Paracoccaceae bacterium]|nr:enoyl-CoA hydratase/isomerase family protein [Paracoccaceae bacterium]